MRQFMGELGYDVSGPSLLRMDNQSAIAERASFLYTIITSLNAFIRNAFSHSLWDLNNDFKYDVLVNKRMTNVYHGPCMVSSSLL